ncbi:ABC transporter ATP-binding protein [Glutamicibacter arilaitensis]|uniref:ATP-binding cassette domain-containing protein n=1 Tax=Glutamicibacter arilaitensis TaxID=256701 RepID=A0A4Y8TXM4_9MICC|nr:ATP-binding cassette domain-containing protein [Glutamicibacter arilaitensis]TFH56284.1 ATP-binding cassette domain-containing protein [Glutamicibacter arilaitensis]
MLELHHISRSFAEHLVLDDISFTVPSGALTGFVGANGAGKTTTMRIIMGLLSANSGSITLNGQRLESDTRPNFGYMPEERGLYPKQPVIDQLIYLGQLHGLTRSGARKRSMELLARFGLDGRAKSKLESLSLGNQQRVQVTASLLHEPDVLILDEPFSGLDPIAVDAMSSILRDYAARGVPVLFSSHQLDLLDVLVDHLVIIQNGKILANSPADQLRRTQASRHRLSLGSDTGWLRDEPGVSVIDISGPDALVSFETESDAQRVLATALSRGPVAEFAVHRPSLADIYREIIK